jgi:hypothetical protein
MKIYAKPYDENVEHDLFKAMPQETERYHIASSDIVGYTKRVKISQKKN